MTLINIFDIFKDIEWSNFQEHCVDEFSLAIVLLLRAGMLVLPLPTISSILFVHEFGTQGFSGGHFGSLKFP